MTNELATIDAPEELKAIVSACVQWSAANVVDSPTALQKTGEHLRAIKTSLNAADDFFDPPIKQAYDLHRMLCQRKKYITDPLSQSERMDKAKMLTYSQEQAAKAEAERRKLQAAADEAARKGREKAEQAAAKQRAIEAEERRKADAARLAAEQADAAERKRLLAEAAAADRKAAAAAAKADAKEEDAAAVFAPVVAVVSAAGKVEGISVRRAWKAEIVDQQVFLLWAIEHGKIDLIIPNQPEIDALARRLKGAFVAAGLRVYEAEIMSARG